MKNELKIYSFVNEDGSQDWVIAQSREEAKELFSNESGQSPEDIPEPIVLTEKRAKESYLFETSTHIDEEDIPEGEEDEYFNGYKILATFEDKLKEATKPYYLGSSE